MYFLNPFCFIIRKVLHTVLNFSQTYLLNKSNWQMNLPRMLKRIPISSSHMVDKPQEMITAQPSMQLDKENLFHDNDPELTEILQMKGYTYIAPIGKGGTATCFLVKSNKYQMNFVCKKCSLDHSVMCSNCELNALKKLNSPEVINIYNFEVTANAIYLFLEYCPNGSLQDIVKNQGPLKGDRLIAVCKSILQGIDFIHSNSCAHLDIKPPNILIDPYGRTKLADFGISRFVDQTENSLNHHCGTLLFMSPELIKHGKYDPFKSDIWALGVTFYWIATGKYPWPRRKTEDTKDAIHKGLTYFPPEFHHGELKSIIRRMLDLSPESRPSAKELLHLSIFKNCDKNNGKLFLQKFQPTPKRTCIQTVGSMLNFTFKDVHAEQIEPNETTNNTSNSTQQSIILSRKCSTTKDLYLLQQRPVRKSCDTRAYANGSCANGKPFVRPKMLQKTPSALVKMHAITEEE